MSADALASVAEPAPVAEEGPEQHLRGLKPPCPEPGMIWDMKQKRWRFPRHNNTRRRRLAAGLVRPDSGLGETLGVGRLAEDKPLPRFDVDDWRKRLQSKSVNAIELALDELRDRLAVASRAQRIPTSTLIRVVKYLDERNVEIAKRMKEEGLEKHEGPIENHQHLTLMFTKTDEDLARMSEPERELYLNMRLAATRALPGGGSGG